MNPLIRAKEIVTSKAVQDFTINLASDIYDALNGDVMAIARIIYALTNGVLSLSENIFWEKFEAFLTGIDLEEDELANFCKILSEDGTKKENITRVIDTIDKIDVQSKALFLANASRCLCAGMIDRTLYFRFCHALKSSLYEDLLFLQENILSDEKYVYSDEVQGLLNVGLMYRSFDGNNGEDDLYSFTPLAKDFDKYSLSYDNDERYPMILEGKYIAEPRQLSIERGIFIEEF